MQMKNRILIFNLIGDLSLKKTNKLHQYFSSDFFKIETKVRRLGLYITEDKKRLSNTPFEIWKAIFNTPFNENAWRSLCSKLFKQYLNFNAHAEIHKNTEIHDYLRLSPALSVNSISQKISKKIKSKIDSHIIRSSNLLEIHSLEKLWYKSKNNEQKRLKRKGNQISDLLRLDDSIDNAYYLEKLKIASRLLAWKGFIEDETHLHNVNKTVISVARNLDSAHPAIQIYFFVFKTLHEPEILEHYYQLKKLLRKNMFLFDQEEKKDLIDTLINYCVIKVNSGSVEFLGELFETYKSGLNEGSFELEGKLSPWTFKNIVSVSLRLKEYKWTEEFILSFSDRLPDSFKESSTSLAKAQLHFYRREYNEVLYSLQGVEYKEFSYATSARSLQLASFYELDEYDLLHDSLVSFRKYLSRYKKLSASRKMHFYNLINFTSKLSKINPNEHDELVKLKDEIQTTKGLASKTWLLEKVDELIGEPKK